MKKVLVGLLVMSFTLSSFAGTLVNRKTREVMKFDKIDDIAVEVTRADGSKVTLDAKSLDKNLSNINPVYLVDKLNNYTNEKLDQGSNKVVTISVWFIATQVAGALTLAALPITGPAKLIQNMGANRDFRTLQQVVSVDKDKVISNRRFKRISLLF